MSELVCVRAFAAPPLTSLFSLHLNNLRFTNPIKVNFSHLSEGCLLIPNSRNQPAAFGPSQSALFMLLIPRILHKGGLKPELHFPNQPVSLSASSKLLIRKVHMNPKQLHSTFGWLLIFAILLSACAPEATSLRLTDKADSGALRLEATSAVRTLEQAGIFASFTQATSIPVQLEYFGDVELMLKVQAYTASKPNHVDAMWLGSPIYAPGRLLQEKTSVMRTYIVTGVRPDTARMLGWQPGSTISIADFINAVENQSLSLAAPSASQDDAGANFLLATIHSFNNKPFISSADLQQESLRNRTKTVFEAVAGSANNAAALSDRFIEDQAATKLFNGFILPENLAIQTNLALEKGILNRCGFLHRRCHWHPGFPVGLD
jgi:hypothetical protein